MQYDLTSSIKVTGVPNKVIDSGYGYVTWRENDIEFRVVYSSVRHNPNESSISITGYPVKDGKVDVGKPVVDRSIWDIWHRRGSHSVPQSSACVYIS